MKLTQIGLIIITILFILSCSKSKDLSHIVTYKSFQVTLKKCKDEGALCVNNFYVKRTINYCRENEIPKEQCRQIVLDVQEKILSFYNKKIEKSKSFTEEINKITKEEKEKITK